MKQERAQLSIEFIIMMSIALTIIVIFLAFGNDLFVEHTNNQKYTALRDYGYTIQSEIILAAKSQPGYSRTITVPQLVENINYTIKSTNTSVEIDYKDRTFLFFLPQFEGNITKGRNHIFTNETTISVEHVT